MQSTWSTTNTPLKFIKELQTSKSVIYIFKKNTDQDRRGRLYTVQLMPSDLMHWVTGQDVCLLPMKEHYNCKRFHEHVTHASTGFWEKRGFVKKRVFMEFFKKFVERRLKVKI